MVGLQFKIIFAVKTQQKIVNKIKQKCLLKSVEIIEKRLKMLISKDKMSNFFVIGISENKFFKVSKLVA